MRSKSKGVALSLAVVASAAMFVVAGCTREETAQETQRQTRPQTRQATPGLANPLTGLQAIGHGQALTSQVRQIQRVQDDRLEEMLHGGDAPR